MGTSEMGASYGSAYPGHGYRSMMGGYGANQTVANGGVTPGAISRSSSARYSYSG